jgi:enoyl-CoA hydratase/carnithine racemase
VSVTYEVVDRVAVVTIDRPEKRNAMSMAVFDGLRDAAARAADDVAGEAAVGAVLVRGAGGVFSSGIDLSTFDGAQGDGGGLDVDFVDRLQSSLTVYEDLQVPTVAQVEGYCFGAGLQLATACHVRLVAPDAQLSLMEVRWGLVPDLGATVRLPRLIGLGRATELALTARKVTADEALAIGLCEVALPGEAPGDAAFAYAARLAAGPAAVRRVPRMFRENVGRDRTDALLAERTTQAEVTAGPDHGEAVAAGMAGRQPTFVGR